jgi:hypothetical protein
MDNLLQDLHGVCRSVFEADVAQVMELVLIGHGAHNMNYAVVLDGEKYVERHNSKGGLIPCYTRFCNRNIR